MATTTTSISTSPPGGAAVTTTPFSSIDLDVIRTGILSRLDGTNLASLSCVSTELHRHATSHDLWSTINTDTWPSTNAPGIRHVIDSFPNGPFSFFSQSFPILHHSSEGGYTCDRGAAVDDPLRPSRLQRVVSAVDISYRGKNILSRVQETETVTKWFRCSPFRIDLLEPKDTVSTPIRKNAADEDTCRDLYGEMTLSWIMIDPAGKQAVNLSSFKPVAVSHHWWNEEVVVRFATIVPSGSKADGGQAMCCIEVTCAGDSAGVGGGDDEADQGRAGGLEEGLHVREVSMRVENVNGAHLSGEQSLLTLERAFGGKRVNREGKGEEMRRRRRYEEFLEMRTESKERRLRNERRQDWLCIGFGLSIFVACFILLV
ncbi:hypothetical protein Dimus_034768 [Dionaea muscipula]